MRLGEEGRIGQASVRDALDIGYPVLRQRVELQDALISFQLKSRLLRV